MDGDLILVIVVAAALAFDFTNGFHDTANVVATSISTRAMAPKLAVGFAAVLNFAGAFLSLAVAATVAQGIVEADLITPLIVFAGLIGAIAWNLVTWYFGLPSSSSHALIGGVVGAAFVAEGAQAVIGAGLVGKVIVPAIVAPILAFAVAGLGILLAYRLVGALRPGPVNEGFRIGQLVSGGMLAIAHGTNDAQKTMGVITLALVANGTIASNDFHVPTWVVVSSGAAISLGTYVGGWRIIKTMGSRIHKMDAAQGYAAQGAGAAVILASSHVGFPLSTTHTISGAVIGAGAAKRLSAVRWGVAGNIVAAWVLTLPASAAIGGLTYGVTRLFGTGAAGAIVVSAADPGRLGPAVRAPRSARPRRHRGGGELMFPLAEVVDWKGLLEVLWSSLAAGLAVTIAASLAILGATRAVDSRRAGHIVPAGLFSLVGAVRRAAAGRGGGARLRGDDLEVRTAACSASGASRQAPSMSPSLVQAPTEALTYGRPGRWRTTTPEPSRRSATASGSRSSQETSVVRPRGATVRPLSRRRSASRSAPSAAAARTSSKPAASSTSSAAADQAVCSGGLRPSSRRSAPARMSSSSGRAGSATVPKFGHAGVSESRRPSRT